MSYSANHNGFAFIFPRKKTRTASRNDNGQLRRRGHRRTGHRRAGHRRTSYSPSFFVAIGVTLLSSVAFVSILAMALSAG